MNRRFSSVTEWAKTILYIPLSIRRITENDESLSKILDDLSKVYGYNRNECLHLMRQISTHPSMTIHSAAWYVHDFHLAYGRLPTKEDV